MDPRLRTADLAGVASVELVRVRLPLIAPFVSSHGTETERDLVLVHLLGEDGVEGWGECEALAAATYTAEDAEGSWTFLRDEVVPLLRAGEAVDVTGRPMAWAAVEVAQLDLTLRRDGASLAAHVGATRTAVPAGAVVGRQASIDALLTEVAGHLERGTASIKLKIEPGWDLEPLRAVRTTWPVLTLAADANGAYTVEHPLLGSIDAVGLAYLEQPLAADAVEGTIVWQRRLETLLALDEAIDSADALGFWLSRGFAGVVNVKLSRVGGVGEATQLITRAHGEGIGAFVGGMLEGGVGRATSLALAGIATLDHPTDLGPSERYFADDLTEPTMSDHGWLTIPAGPGVGAVPRPERLAACTVDRVTFPR